MDDELERIREMIEELAREGLTNLSDVLKVLEIGQVAEINKLTTKIETTEGLSMDSGGVVLEVEIHYRRAFGERLWGFITYTYYHSRVTLKCRLRLSQKGVCDQIEIDQVETNGYNENIQRWAKRHKIPVKIIKKL